MRRVFSILLDAVLLFSLALSAAATMPYGLMDSPWPKYHRDAQNTGLSPYCGPPAGDLKWAYRCGRYCQSSPVIGADGTIYVGSHDAKLHAINPDGSGKWTYTTGDMIWGGAAIGEDGTIYIGSYDDYLYAINPDGTLKWRYGTGSNISCSPALGEDGTIYFGSWDRSFYALEDSVTYGKLKWKYTGTGWFAFSSPAVGQDGTVYVGSYDDSLYAFNPDDGTKKWAYATGGNIWSSPAVGGDGTIYVGSYDDKLHAVNPDGSQKWAYLTGGNVIGSPAIGEDGTIYVGSNDRKLHAISPDGIQQWTFGTGSSVQSCAAIGSDGVIYVGSLDDKVYAVNPDGSELWSYLTGHNVVSSPAIDKDGTLYIGSQDSNLYAFRGPPPGLVTGGGWIPGDQHDSGNKRTFGFNAHRQACVVWGQLQFNDHATKMKVHGETIENLSDNVTVATFSGTCRVNHVSGYSFECEVEDNGEPGRGVDKFSIDIYGAGGSLYYSAGDLLGGGNIQIHLPDSGYVKSSPVTDADLRDGPNPRKEEDPLPGGRESVRNSLNLFADQTTISFHLPVSGHITLRVYDGCGRLVVTLINENLSAGDHSVTWERGNVPSGIYFCTLTAGSYTATGKLVLLK